MARPSKDYKYFSVKMDREIFERLEDYCEKEGRTKTTAVERILKEYLDEYDKKNKSKK